MPLDESMEPQPVVHTHTPVPGFSLLRASTAQRLALVAAMLAVLWLSVLWALS